VNRPVVAGLLLFLAIFQFFMFFRVAESIYQGYSVSNNYISDLGVGPAAGVFNTSIVVLGLAVMAAAYLALPAFRSRVLSFLVGLAGFGATGVGVFPENVPVLHKQLPRPRTWRDGEADRIPCSLMGSLDRRLPAHRRSPALTLSNSPPQSGHRAAGLVWVLPQTLHLKTYSLTSLMGCLATPST
jgi:hypothetical protein